MTATDDFRKEIVQILKQVSKTPLPKGEYFKAIGSEKYVSFPNVISQQYNRCIRILRERTRNSGKLISDEALEKKLDEFIVKQKYTCDQEKMKKEIDKHITALFKDLKSMKSTKYLFIVPIMNLELKEDIEIGDSKLTNLTVQILESLNSKHSLKFSYDGNVLPNVTDELPKHNETSTYAIVVVEAPDNSKALELALQKSETCLNILRLFFYNPSVLLRDEYKKYLARMLVRINLDEKTFSMETMAINTNNLFPTKIDKKIIEDLKIYLPIINKMLDKKANELTPLQEDLLTAILWFGSASKENERNMRFVKTMMALEAILVPDGGKGKQVAIAKRFTSIIYASDTDAKKIQVYERMRNMYELRNSIVHSGSGYVHDDDLEQVMYWARLCIQNLLQRAEKFANLQEALKKEFPIDESLYGRNSRYWHWIAKLFKRAPY